ncbi:MAG: hypothetical protein ACRD0W_24255 [Acidimicrobiales bacterium]
MPTNGGKTRPAKLDTFRLTSADRVRIGHAATLYGGEPRQWQAPAGPQWEVITTTDALGVIVPPSDMAFSQHYELWSAGGCQRRCDGQAEQITQGPCLCDPENRECDIHTRLSVMLRDLPGLGVWRIDTSGYYAAVELQGAVEVIQVAAGRGQMLPARLRLEQRSVKRPGDDGKPQTRRFAVPVLDVEVSPGQLLAGAAPRPEVGPGDGAARLTPVPAALPSGPAQSIAEQAAQVDEEPSGPPRRNAAQPIAETGLRPRTAADAAADAPATEGMTSPQRRKMNALMKEQELVERSARLAYVGKVIGRGVDSSNELTKAEASQVIDALEADKVALGDPPPETPGEASS